MITTSQVLYDGQGNVTMQFTGLSEGDNETLVTKVDVSALTPVPVSTKIMDVEYDVSGGLLQIFWDALDPVKFLELAGNSKICYERENGAVNKAKDLPGFTGDIKISTVGFDVGSSYSFKLVMKKKY